MHKQFNYTMFWIYSFDAYVFHGFFSDKLIDLISSLENLTEVACFANNYVGVHTSIIEETEARPLN